MKISIPDKIRSSIDVIDTVWLETAKVNAGEKSPAFSGHVISVQHIKACDFVFLVDGVYNACDRIQFKVLYRDGTTKIFKYLHKKEAKLERGENDQSRIVEQNDVTYFHDICSRMLSKTTRNQIKHIISNIEYRLGRFFLCVKNKIVPPKPQSKSVSHTGAAKDLIKQNVQSSYPNSALGKKHVFEKSNIQHNKALELSNQPFGEKHLIYYSVAGSRDWIDLLNVSLNSVVENNDVGADILVITTSDLATGIKKQDHTNKINIDFMIVPEPVDGIEASMNKLLIYKYDKTTKYNKILFLDCDTKVVKPLSNIFNVSLNSEKFYTAWSSFYVKKIGYSVFSQPFHGIGMMTEDDIKTAEINQQRPFNAGQFLFVSTQQMLKHMENVHWLSKQWPGDYFFEQAFLVHYMCFNNLTDCSVLDSMVNLYSIDAKDPSCVSTKEINDENVVIYHFIGKSANIEYKLNFIRNFANANI